MSAPPYQAFLLVDGYNIIGSWSDLKKSRDRHGLEIARNGLIESLVNFAPMVDYRTKIVFDAHFQNTPSYSEEYTPLVSVHFTAFAETADTYIEKFCADFKSTQYQEQSSRLIVATNDRAQKLTVTGYGAECISAQRLAGEVEITSRRAKRNERPAKKSAGRFLFHALDPIAQERFRQMRQGK
ncbi:MAG: NYN domain-containing protein [Cyanobacteria bacterium P01_F01_bin.143]